MRYAALAMLLACGSSTGNPSQVPPTESAAALEDWLAAGHYRSWHCEGAPHAPRSPSPHGEDRICSNDAVSGHGQGEYPVDAAAVKELWSGGAVVGHSVYRHVSAGKGGGNWFWYERYGSTVSAFGTGDSGTARSICAACHGQAGTSPSFSGHDFVFTQVR